MESLTAINAAVQTIKALLGPEFTSFLGVKEKVKDLQKELEWMQSFLEEGNARKLTVNVVHIAVAEIRELAYDAEDVIETFRLEVESKRQGGFLNVMKRLACFLMEVCLLCQTKCEVEKLVAHIKEVKERLQAYDSRRLGDEEAGSSSSSSYDQRRESRRPYPHVIDDNIVGMDDDINTVVSMLVDDDEEEEGSHSRNYNSVVSIWGMGGLGKTTLAKKVHHHSRVRSHFKHLAWVYVSQQFQQRKVWEDILSCLTSKNERESKKSEETLAEEICNFMKENKCLVILDDIWTVEAWDSLKPAFPSARDNSRSKILLTSRNREVGSDVDRRRYLHELECLKEKESWELFHKIAFSGRYSTGQKIDAKMEEIGKEMLKHCGGLPLAIIVLAGILRERSSFVEWQTVHANVKSQLRRAKGRAGIEIGDLLALSYDDLPPYLKPRFLYLSIFPEDFEIKAERLIQLWMAEGFISSNPDKLNEGEIVEDVAKGYLNELAERCMIQVGERDKATLKIISFRMHDLMRDLCLLMAKQEKLLCILDRPNFDDQNGNKFSTSIFDQSARRLVADQFYDIKCVRNPHLRSLFFFGDFCSQESIEKPQPQNMLNCIPKEIVFGLLPLDIVFHKIRGSWAYMYSNLKLLRVLHLEGETDMVFKLPSGIGDLIHLRFLSLKGMGWHFSRKLPSSLGNLRCLQTLDLGVRVRIEVPNVVWRLKQLRHLYLPEDFKCKSNKLKLDTLGNLVTLVNFNTEACYGGDLLKMTNLRELVIYGPFSLEDFKEEDYLNSNPPLQYLRSLSLNNVCITSKRLDPRHFAYLLSSCANICKLSVQGHKLEKLPEYHHFSSNIAYVYLFNCCLEEDPMQTLEKLPNLKILELSIYAFLGKEMVCSKEGFSKLDSLILCGLFDLEEWKVEKGGMPALRYLEINGCSWLKMLPDGLRFITTFQELKIKYMPKDFKDKVEKWKDQYLKNSKLVPYITYESIH